MIQEPKHQTNISFLKRKEEALNPTIYAPAHYVEGRQHQLMDVIEDWGFDKNHYRACALKYLCRAGRKGSALEDLEKAVWYLQREIQKIQKG